MRTANQCCRNTESQFSMRTVFNYCALLFLVSVFTMSGWSIQRASAQTASGILRLTGPIPDPSPNEEFVVSVEIENPRNVYVFQMTIEYPDTLEFSENPIEPGAGQFSLAHLSIGNETQNETQLEGGRVQRRLNLANNTDFISAGTLFTIKFETSEIRNYRIAITARDNYTRLQNNRASGDPISANALPSLNVGVRGPKQATVNPVPPIGTVRVGETTFIDIELKSRSRVHSYEITVDPSDNLGALTVSYNADDTNTTAITNHTAGDPITIGANPWLPNDPLDNIVDWGVSHADHIVATLLFTPTAAGEGSIAITAAKILDSDNTELVLTNPDTLTFTIASQKTNVVYRDTGVGPMPFIEVDDGVKDGPFEIAISFASENYIEQQHRRLENGVVVEVLATFHFQRGVYGFARDEIEIGGDAGASVTTRLWEADGAQLYYARINPTATGAREVTLQIPVGVVREVGTNLPNVASEIVTVSTNLEYPPWDVDEDGRVNDDDAEVVEAALGLGLEARSNFAFYVNTINSHQRDLNNDMAVDQVDLDLARRSDVNGDLYVNQVDLDLVRAHIPDDGGMQRRSEVRAQPDAIPQVRSAEPEPDVSAWMPDANLRKAIRKALSIATDEDFTQAQLATLTKLTAAKKGINDITGLEYATNLKKLDIRTNRITDISPLEGLTKLTELKIATNNINDITALAGLTELTFLGLTGNEVSDITALENLTKVKELWMRENNISDITPLTNLTRLIRLSLGNNAVSDTTALGSLTKLIYLNLTDNEVSDVTALGNLVRLQELGMSNNNISDISPLSSLTKLKKLVLAGNSILDTSPLYSLTQGALKNVDITVSQYPPWDVNEDGSVDATDSALVTAALGQSGNDIVDDRTDVNGDGTVNQDDLTLVTDNLDTDGGAPSTSDLLTLLERETLETLNRATLETYLNALRAESDRSPKYLRAIAMLENLLAATRPKQTQLLANYPNPFNPETWIPYQLANASDVQISIYDTHGTVVRQLALGHQPEGYYTTRSRAAYWDGRNTFGERVVSGIYFYQFQADNISSLRKLLILK